VADKEGPSTPMKVGEDNPQAREEEGKLSFIKKGALAGISRM